MWGIVSDPFGRAEPEPTIPLRDHFKERAREHSELLDGNPSPVHESTERRSFHSPEITVWPTPSPEIIGNCGSHDLNSRIRRFQVEPPDDRMERVCQPPREKYFIVPRRR